MSLSRYILLLITLGALQPMALLAAEADKARDWECFPQPSGRAGLVCDIAEDSKGRIWIMSGSEMCYWDASAKKWSGNTVSAYSEVNKFFGGPKTGLYATQKIPPVEDKTKPDPIPKGNVLLLDSGDPTPVTQFIYDHDGSTPGFHVLGPNRFLNWCKGKIRIYANGKWTAYKTDIHQYGPILLEGGGQVTLLHNRKLYSIQADNKVKVIRIDPKIMAKPERYAMLGKRTVVVFERLQSVVQAFDIRTGKRVELKHVNALIAGRIVRALDSTPDGCLWVSVDASGETYPIIIRIAPDGAASMFEQAAGPEWPFKSSCTTIDADGTYWGITRNSVLRMRDGNIKQFDSRTDGSPTETCANYKGNDGSGLFCDSKGIIYVGGQAGKLYAYNQGESLTGAPPFQAVETAELSQPAWRVDHSIAKAWHIGDTILYTQHFKPAVTAVSASTGKPLFTMNLEGQHDPNNIWVDDSEEPGRFIICTRDKIFTLDAKSGEILATAITTHDNRIPPIGVLGGYIVPKGSKGETIVRMKSDGTQIWERKLDGVPHAPATERLSLLIVQTYESIHGVQTVAIDGETGEPVWAKITKGRGMGVVFMKDATNMVEVNSYIFPNATEIICRESISGEPLWTYDAKGGMCYQGPCLDPATDRIYSCLTDGSILCLNGKNGELAWKSTLPASPAIGNGLYSSASDFHVMFLLNDKLAVVGSDGMLYLLDAKSGRLLRRVKILEDIIQNGIRIETQILASGPWLINDLLIIPSRDHLRAYPLEDILE